MKKHGKHSSGKRRRVSGQNDDEYTDETIAEAVMEYLQNNKDIIVKVVMDSDVVRNFEEALNNMHKEIDSLKEQNEELKHRLALSDGRLMRAEKEMDTVKEKVIEITARSMQNNVIFKNIPESVKETNTLLEQKVVAFLKDEMKLNETDMKSVEIEKIHRVGAKRNGKNKQFIRNVIARFNSKGKDIIFQNIRNVNRDCPIKINQQFPQEVHTRRDKLWDEFKAAKDAGQKPRWIVDKLQIGERIVTAPKDRVRDINLDIADTAIKMDTRHTPTTAVEGNHFQGHSVPIKSVDDVIPAIKALYKDTRIAGASHVMYAYRVGKAEFSIANFEDDGEWGAGRKIMEILDRNEVYNRLICVTRWFNGKHVGSLRFDTIRQLAQDAINIKHK
jgi:hypothetical protein